MRGRAGELAWGAAAAVTSLVVAVVVLQIWRGSLHVPLDYTNDARLNAIAVKGMLDHGWFLRNPSLGAPFGQRLYDFPFADNLSLLAMKIIGVGARDWATTINVYFLATFPLAAASAFAVARRLAVASPAAAAVAVLYADAPYHFLRGEQHLFLSAYFTVPLAVWVAHRVLAGTVFERQQGRRWRGWLTRRNVAVVAAIALVASSVQYYPLFLVGLLVPAAILRAWAHRRPSAALPGLAAAGAVVGVFLVNLLPNLWFRFSHGANADVAHRSLGETAIFSMRMSDLVVPMTQHRLPLFRDVARKTAAAFGGVPEFGAGALGIVAAAGFLGLLAHAARSIVESRRVEGDDVDRHLSLLTVLAFLLGTVGGLTAILAATVGSPLRAWNRLSIFLAFFALVALGRAWTRLRASGTGAVRLVAAVVLVIVVVVVGLLDQTSPSFVPNYALTAATWRSDAAFVHAIERHVPRHGMVLQVPYLQFPENGPYRGMTDYDPARGYLHSQRVRWSYGAVRTRPEDWQRGIRDLDPEATVVAALAAGFDGIWVDRQGFADAGLYEARLAAVLETQATVSPDGRFSFFAVDGDATRTARLSEQDLSSLRPRVLHAVVPVFGRGFFEAEGDFDHSWRWSGPSATLQLSNSVAARDVVVRASVETAGGRPGTLTITSGGRRQVVPLAAGKATPVAVRIHLRRGANAVVLSSDIAAVAGGDGRDLRVRFVDLAVTDAAVVDAAAVLAR